MKLYFAIVCLVKLWKEDFYIHQYAQYTGTGALILTAYLDHKKEKLTYIKLFILSIIVLSFFEYFVGFALEALFAETWWDYSYSKYNLAGRITLLNSFLWGVIAVFFRRFIYPLIQIFREKIIYKVPNSIQIILATILISGILIDFILSCIKYLN